MRDTLRCGGTQGSRLRGSVAARPGCLLQHASEAFLLTWKRRLCALRRYIEHLLEQQAAAGVPASRVVLGGFSQGGAMALLALRSQQQLAGVLALSAFMPLHGEQPLFSGERRWQPGLHNGGGRAACPVPPGYSGHASGLKLSPCLAPGHTGHACHCLSGWHTEASAPRTRRCFFSVLLEAEEARCAQAMV